MIKIWSELPGGRAKEQVADFLTLAWLLFWGSIIWQLFTFLNSFGVAGRTIREGGQNHVAQVFDHVTLGGGFAGVGDEMSRPGRSPEDIIIGGANPWDGATSKFGQPAGDSELPNHAPGHGMTETSRDPGAEFMAASDHADNVALNRNDAQIKTYDGRAGALEPGPQPDWPQFAKDGGATVRTKVIGPDGEPRYFYTKLGELKVKGILTQEEFDAKKAELLKKLV